jgi:flagellar protein FlaF
MGFSTLAGFVIVLMVSITIAGYLLHAMIDQIKEINKFSKLENEMKLNIKNSNFEIVKITALNTSSTTYDLTVIVKNTGATTFNCEKFSILVDGVLVNYTVNVSKLYPLESAEFKAVDLSGTVGSSHRIMVVSDNGIRRMDTFTVV